MITRRQKLKRLRREQNRERKWKRFVDRIYERMWDRSVFRRLLLTP